MKPYQFFTFEKVTYDESENKFLYVFKINIPELCRELNDEFALIHYKGVFNSLYFRKLARLTDIMHEKFNDFGNFRRTHMIFENLFITDDCFVFRLFDHENEDEYKEILDIAIKIAIKEYKKQEEDRKQQEERNKKEAERISKKLEEITKRNTQ